MKKIPKIYTAVLLGVLIHVTVYSLFNVGMATYCCGINLWSISETWGNALMIAAYPLWGVAVLLGILGFCFPKLRKAYLIYMTVCYAIELACYIGMFFIPSYWVIPLGWLDPLLYLLAIAVCAVGLWRSSKTEEKHREERSLA